MLDPLIKAKLAELAARAEVTKIKAERSQHWEGELRAEVDKIAALAKEISQQIAQEGR